MTNEKKKVAVLVSGGGTNLQAILDAEKSGSIKSGEVSGRRLVEGRRLRPRAREGA